MQTHISDIHFERNKNIKAFAITIISCAALFLFFFFIRWSQPVIEPPTADEGIEVNLGNSETGFGDIPPAAPGDFAENDPTEIPVTEQPIAEQIIDDKGDEPIAAAPISTPKKTTPKPAVKDIIKTPPTPKPKAVFSGGTKTNEGGNNNDSYNAIKNQGIAGGKGDQGNPKGNTNSDSYSGNSSSGNNGIKIRSGLTGRFIAVMPRFQDEFNENAKVAIDVKIDANGKVIYANVNPRGTTTTNANIRQIAKNKALQVKFTTGSEEQTGTIVFDFRVTN
ncbi:MAG: hypothetical protein KGZ59_04915 [Chitinophagaceae bacterium]|nr:hypothetical protein [Chitinophagaceae bacterium]